MIYDRWKSNHLAEEQLDEAYSDGDAVPRSLAEVDQMDRLGPVKLPLRVAANNDPEGHVRIADADNRIVCRIVIPDGRRIAGLIVSVLNSGLP